MIGYIKPNKDELKLKHIKFFNSLYCGFCFKLKKYSNLSRLFISYDIIFFYLLFISNFKNLKYSFYKNRCPFNPFKKIDIYLENNYLKIFSEFSILITVFKAYDNLYDSKNPIKFFFTMHFIKFLMKKLRYINVYINKPLENIKLYFKNEKEIFFKLNNSFNNFFNFQIDDINRNKLLFTKNYFENLELFFDNLYKIFIKFIPFDYLDSNIKNIYCIIIYNILKIITIIDALDDLYNDIKNKKDNILMPLFFFFFNITQKSDFNILNIDFKNLYKKIFKLIKKNKKEKKDQFEKIFENVKELIKPVLFSSYINIKTNYEELKKTNKSIPLYNEELLDNYIYFSFDNLIWQTLSKNNFKIK